MAKIKIETITNIDFDQWIAQARRFAKIEDRVTLNPMPIDIDTSTHASIEVQIKNPLIYGLDAVISYWQNYTVDEPYQEMDPVNFEPVGEPTLKSVEKRKEIIRYTEKLDKATINHLLEQTLPLVDPNISYLERQEMAIKLIVIGNAVQFKTFGLSINDWK